MTYVLDTHAVVWYLEQSRRLAPSAVAILNDSASVLVIPTIVLGEIWHLHGRGRIQTSVQSVRTRLIKVTNCSVQVLNNQILDLLPPGFELHDAIILATAIFQRDVLRQPTKLLTIDQKIVSSRLIETVW